MGANVYSPVELVVLVTTTPVSSLTTVTLAPGMIRPLESFTVPRIAPASTWASRSQVPHIKTATIAEMRANSLGVWLGFQMGKFIVSSNHRLCGVLEQHPVLAIARTIARNLGNHWRRVAAADCGHAGANQRYHALRSAREHHLAAGSHARQRDFGASAGEFSGRRTGHIYDLAKRCGNRNCGD